MQALKVFLALMFLESVCAVPSPMSKRADPWPYLPDEDVCDMSIRGNANDAHMCNIATYFHPASTTAGPNFNPAGRVDIYVSTSDCSPLISPAVMVDAAMWRTYYFNTFYKVKNKFVPWNISVLVQGGDGNGVEFHFPDSGPRNWISGSPEYWFQLDSDTTHITEPHAKCTTTFDCSALWGPNKRDVDVDVDADGSDGDFGGSFSLDAADQAYDNETEWIASSIVSRDTSSHGLRCEEAPFRPAPLAPKPEIGSNRAQAAINSPQDRAASPPQDGSRGRRE